MSGAGAAAPVGPGRTARPRLRFGAAQGARAEPLRFKIALANLDETPGVTLEGLGFTGSDVRRSFEMAARTRAMLYFDNAGDRPAPSPMPRPRLPQKSTC